jgi:GntR family transcriptional regulator, rspAB operon transcriptional repressor
MERAGVHSGSSKVREAVPYGFLPALPRQGRGRTTQRVQDIIRDAIVALSFTPGEFIQKEAICRRLGVSRFPVSEALGRLADEGFVEILPQRGTRVSRIDIASCRQAMFIRQALEGEAMRVIAPRASDDLIARLDQNIAEQKLALERANAAWFSQIDLAFHDMLLSELGYDRVRSVLEAARGSLNRTRMFLLRTTERQAETHREHVAIVDALRAHDPDAARRAMAAHLDRSLDEIETGATQNPEIFALASGSPPT